MSEVAIEIYTDGTVRLVRPVKVGAMLRAAEILRQAAEEITINPPAQPEGERETPQ